MTKTEHYQLNQWDAGDRVLREDFNEDNRKIDAVLKELAQPELLQDITTTTAATRLHIDLSDIDLAEYRKFILRPTFLTTTNYTVYLYFNNVQQENSVMETSNGNSALTYYYAFFRTYPQSYYEQSAYNQAEFDLTTAQITCSFQAASSYKTSASGSFVHSCQTGFSAAKALTWDQVTELTLSCDSSLLAGSTIKLYGVK